MHLHFECIVEYMYTPDPRKNKAGFVRAEVRMNVDGYLLPFKPSLDLWIPNT